MLQQLILSERNWTYALIEYDLAYEPLKSMKGQVVADFIVRHSIDQNNDESCNLVLIHPWKLFFDGSTCREGQGVVVLVSPQGAIFEQSVRLVYYCTNNQAEYEVILLDLQILSFMDIKHVNAFGDLLLVVRQVACMFQCFDGSLNAYLDKCLKIIALFNDCTVRQLGSMIQWFDGSLNAYLDKCLKMIALFNNCIVQHVSRDENTLANDLVQQALGFRSNQGKFNFLEKLDVPVCQARESSFWSMHSAIVCSAKPSLAKPDVLVSETEGSRISRILNESSETTTADPDAWRTPLVCYLENPGHIADRKVQRQALKYVMLDNTLYRRTIDELLLKSLGSDQSKIAMGEIHEGICGTHQSTHKIKWLFHRARFYWSTMINDCFSYYKGYELCQKFGDVQLAPAAMLHPIIKPWSFHDWALDFIS
jgi:ribonuclease HI